LHGIGRRGLGERVRLPPVRRPPRGHRHAGRQGYPAPASFLHDSARPPILYAHSPACRVVGRVVGRVVSCRGGGMGECSPPVALPRGRPHGGHYHPRADLCRRTRHSPRVCTPATTTTTTTTTLAPAFSR
jgi:hypothetical protein